MTSVTPSPARDRRGMVWAVLAGVVLVQGALSTWWMHAHGFLTRPPTSDAAWFRIDALGLLGEWEGGWVGFIGRVLAHDRPHPPTLPALAALVAHLRGHDDAILTTDAFCVTLFFGAVFTLGAYRLARVFLDRWLSVVAAAMTACIPVIVVNQRAFYPQMPMSAVSIWVVAELLRSEGFTRRGASIRFGLFAGAATMLKMLAPLTFAGAAVFTLVARMKSSGPKRAAWVNLGLAILVAGLVMAPWYAEHWKSTLKYADAVTGSKGQELFSRGIPVESIERWVYYPLAIFNNGLTPPVTLLVALAAFFAWRRSRNENVWDVTTGRHRSVLFGVNFAVGWLVTTYGQVAGEAFYMQAFLPPAMVLLVHEAFREGPVRVLRRGLLILVGAWMLWLGLRSFRDDEVNAALTWPSAEWRSESLKRNHLRVELLPRIDYMNGWFAVAAGANDSPEGEHWPNEEWASLIRARARDERPKMTSLIDPMWIAYEHPYLSHPTLVYEALRQHWRPHWIRTEKLYETPDVPSLINKVRDLDYIVVDHRGSLSRDAIMTMLASCQIPATVIASVEATAVSHLSLIEIRRAHDLGRFVADLPTAGAVTHPAAATFGSAFRLAAVSHREDTTLGAVVHVWLEAQQLADVMSSGALAPTEAVLRLEDPAGNWLGASVARVDPFVRPIVRADGRYMSVLFDRFKIPAGSAIGGATLTFRPRGEKNDANAFPVSQTTLKRRGNTIVLPW